MFAYHWRGAAARLPLAALFALLAAATPNIGNPTPSTVYNYTANASALAASALAASALAASEILLDPFPYYFPDQNEPANLFPMPPCNGITLEEATIDQLQDYMSQGKLTSVQLVMCYMQRELQTKEYIKYVSCASTSTGGPGNASTW